MYPENYAYNCSQSWLAGYDCMLPYAGGVQAITLHWVVMPQGGTQVRVLGTKPWPV